MLVRPRPGDFVYNSDEFRIIIQDIKEAKRAGADGWQLSAVRNITIILLFQESLLAHSPNLDA